MNREKEFFEALGQVPELPEGLYQGIAGRIRQRTIVTRTFFAAAAMFVVALGITSILLTGQTGRNAGSYEVATELQNVHDYLNGNDLNEELKVYAVYYNEEY
jgi:hypothetical protein